MPAKKYLVPDTATGGVKQQAAVVVSAGAGNDGDLVALDATGKLDSTVLPVGVGADTVTLVTSEAIAAGDFVNIYNNAGTPTCRKADASVSGKEARGFVLAAFGSGATATVYLRGQNTQRTGLTAVQQFLSVTTPGGVQNTAPATAGQVIQPLGVAVSATNLPFSYNPPILLA